MVQNSWEGLEQNFNRLLFEEHNIVQSAENHCLFRCDATKGSQFFVLVWIDDILYFSNNDKMLHGFKTKIIDAFNIDDRGKMTWFLGSNVEQPRGRIFWTPVIYKGHFAQMPYV